MVVYMRSVRRVPIASKTNAAQSIILSPDRRSSADRSRLHLIAIEKASQASETPFVDILAERELECGQRHLAAHPCRQRLSRKHLQNTKPHAWTRDPFGHRQACSY